jgi:hypothetical protein
MPIPVLTYQVYLDDAPVLAFSTEHAAAEFVGYAFVRQASGALLTPGAFRYAPVSESLDAPTVADVRAMGRVIDDDALVASFTEVQAAKAAVLPPKEVPAADVPLEVAAP